MDVLYRINSQALCYTLNINLRNAVLSWHLDEKTKMVIICQVCQV